MKSLRGRELKRLSRMKYPERYVHLSESTSLLSESPYFGPLVFRPEKPKANFSAQTTDRSCATFLHLILLYVPSLPRLV